MPSSPSTRAPRILLADCDQMFVAVARQVDPEGAGRAAMLVVGGRPGSRGVVCSASYEARVFGVRSGMPIAQASRLCPNAVFVPVPRGACGEKSREVRRALSRWAPVVEAASIDEFYLDLSGTEGVYRDEPLADTARRIRADVLEQTGMRLSFGGGTNRLVAKLAAERAKPRPGTGGTGVLIVPPGAEPDFLATHTLADLPGVGPRLQAALRRLGLESVRDALAVESRRLVAALGPRTGAWLAERIRGRASAIVAAGGDPKSMSREETFPRDLAADADLETELLELVTRVGQSLRAGQFRARSVTVKLRDRDFRTRQASRTLDESIDSDRAIYAAALDLFRELRRRRTIPARLLGVTAGRLEPASMPGGQLELDDPGGRAGETPRDRALARLVDDVNHRFGRHAIEPARLKSRHRASARDDATSRESRSP